MGRLVFSCVKQGEAEAITVREEGRSLPRSRSSGVKDGQRPPALLHVPERLMAQPTGPVPKTTVAV